MEQPDPKQQDVERFSKRVAHAKRRRDMYTDIIDECYEYAIPLRERTYNGTEGSPSNDNVFDSTAPAATQALASQMLDDIWPTDSQPFELKAGPEVDASQVEDVNKALATVTDDVTSVINDSNFRSAAHEALMDWAVGEGYLLPEDGMDSDPTVPLVNRTLTLAEAITDVGPTGQKDMLARYRKIRRADVRSVYPNATFSKGLLDKLNENGKDNEDLTFCEAWERDRADRSKEKWVWRVINVPQSDAGQAGGPGAEKEEMIYRREISGPGSKPFIDFAYTRAHGELLGRGPVMTALPTIKTLNLVQQMILENAEMAIAGIYQAEDDGVLNPDTVLLEPRTVIPISPNSRGLTPVGSASDFNVGDLIIQNLQRQIVEIMLGDDLGAPEGTPMSATEVLERSANTARRRAGPYTRLLTEFLQQYVKRVVYIRKSQGRIQLPAIDGRTIAIRPLAPLTRAQSLDQVQRHLRFAEMVRGIHGEQQAMLFLDAEKAIPWLAERMGEDPRNIRSSTSRKQLVEALTQAAAMQEQIQGGGA